MAEQLSAAEAQSGNATSDSGEEIDSSYEFVERLVYAVRLFPLQNTAPAQHAWLQLLKVISQCADPKLPQISCLRTAVLRCNRLLNLWKFPRMPLAINALLVQSTAGKEDQTVTINRLWDPAVFTQRFPPPAQLPADVDALHAMFREHNLNAISPAQLVDWYTKHYRLEDKFRFVVACLTEIPSCLHVMLSHGPDHLSEISSLLEAHPEQARVRGFNGHLPLHRVFAYVSGQTNDGGDTESSSTPRFRPLFASEHRLLLCGRFLEVYPEASRLLTNMSSFFCGDDGFAPIHLECRLGPFASGEVIQMLSRSWLGFFSKETPSLMMQMRCQEPTPSFWKWLWTELTSLHCTDEVPATTEAEGDSDSVEVLARLVELNCLSADAADALRKSFEAFSTLPADHPLLASSTIDAGADNVVLRSYLQYPSPEGFATSLTPEVRADPSAEQFFNQDDHTKAIIVHLAKLFRVYWRPHHVAYKAEVVLTENVPNSTDVDSSLIQLQDYRKVAGSKGEAILVALLDAAEIPRFLYQTEEQQQQQSQATRLLLEDELANAAAVQVAVDTRTPDFLFSSPVSLQGVDHPVSWIDAKSGWIVPFLTPLHHLASLVEQMLAYKELFCVQCATTPQTLAKPTCGLVFWRYGAVPHLLSIVPKGVYVATSEYCFEFGDLSFAGGSQTPGDDARDLSQQWPLGASEGTWDISYADLVPGRRYAREHKKNVQRELRNRINARLQECFPRGTSFAPYPKVFPRPFL